MNEGKTVVTNSGIGVVEVLTIVFVVLKLVHVIDWSWWWVLSPLWIAALLFIAVLAIVAIVAVIVMLVQGK